MSRRVSSERFVVRGLGTRELRERLGSAFRVTDLGSGEAAIVEPEGGTADADPKATWRRVQDRVGQAALVAPVLVDDRGGTSYPTGHIQVRFQEPPGADRGAAFAERNGLRLLEQNRHQPAQCLFEPIDRGAYLPELVTRLESAAGVKRAWEVTEAAYERGQARATD